MSEPQGQQPAPGWQLGPDESSRFAPPPPTRSSVGRWILFACGLALLVALVGAAATIMPFWTDQTKVGDCMANVDRTTLKTVDCSASNAVYKVVAIVEDHAPPTDLSNPCRNNRGASVSYWQGKPGGTGRVLCLKPQ